MFAHPLVLAPLSPVVTVMLDHISVKIYIDKITPDFSLKNFVRAFLDSKLVVADLLASANTVGISEMHDVICHRKLLILLHESAQWLHAPRSNRFLAVSGYLFMNYFLLGSSLSQKVKHLDCVLDRVCVEVVVEVTIGTSDL